MALTLRTGVEMTGGAFGRLPKHLVLSPDVSPEVLFLLGYRCLHADGRSAWGCNPRMMANAVRAGWSNGVFKRAVRDAKAGGYLVRRQGKKKRPGRDTRGRGLAVDSLTFDVPQTNYVLVEQELFNGSLTPKEITLFLFLLARSHSPTKPWELEQRLNATRPTINRIVRRLTENGLVSNHGTPSAPLWGVASLKNPTFKNATFKKTTHSRSAYSSRGISPPRSIEKTHGGTAPALEGEELGRTDSDRGRGGTINPFGEHLRFTPDTRAMVEGIGVNYDTLLDKYHKYAKKNAAEGTPISNPYGYLLEMARGEVAKVFGTQVDLHAINFPNEWTRAQALAEVMGAPPRLPPEREHERINRRLRAEGLDPDQVLADWQKTRRECSTTADFSTFADAKRMERRKVENQKHAAEMHPPRALHPIACPHLEASTTVHTQNQDQWPQEHSFPITPDKKLVIKRNASTGAP